MWKGSEDAEDEEEEDDDDENLGMWRCIYSSYGVSAGVIWPCFFECFGLFFLLAFLSLLLRLFHFWGWREERVALWRQVHGRRHDIIALKRNPGKASSSSFVHVCFLSAMGLCCPALPPARLLLTTHAVVDDVFSTMSGHPGRMETDTKVSSLDEHIYPSTFSAVDTTNQESVSAPPMWTSLTANGSKHRGANEGQQDGTYR